MLVIADKVSSVQTTGNCLNLLLTKATTRTFVTNFHLVENLKQLLQTGQGIHIFSYWPQFAIQAEQQWILT